MSDFTIVQLGEEKLDHVMQLQDQIHEELQQQQHANYIIPKTEDCFRQYLCGDNGLMFGVMVTGQTRHVAQAVLELPKNPGNPTSMTDMALPVPENRLAVISGALVHPDFRGWGLQSLLLHERCRQAAKLERHEIVAEIELSNSFSLRNLLKAGFQVVSTATDPSDGALLLNARRSLTHRPLFGKAKDEICLPLPLSASTFPALSSYLDSGYVATSLCKNGSAEEGLVLRPVHAWKKIQTHAALA
ncbi:MAG: hypothetical protein IPI58_06975 [Alphaproteobacteria bacterium]|nr:MAG: hypothetical protein IPI58_06975 [Alphaproteobacteria bacterium]